MAAAHATRIDAEDGWEAAEFDLRLLDGDPDLRVLIVHDGDAAGSGPSAGFAKVAPSSFEITLEWDEAVHVVEGAATVAVDGGEPVELAPGTGAYFPRGAVCRWTVSEPLLEFFALST